MQSLGDFSTSDFDTDFEGLWVDDASGAKEDNIAYDLGRWLLRAFAGVCGEGLLITA